MVYTFDVNKYKKIFDSMYGAGAYDSGIALAQQVGNTNAQAKFAQQDYMQRLKDAQDAAKQAQAAANAENQFNQKTGLTYDDLLKQFRDQQQQAQQSPLDQYYANESKNLNKGRKIPQKKVEQVFPGVIRPPAENPNLTDWAKVKLFMSQR